MRSWQIIAIGMMGTLMLAAPAAMATPAHPHLVQKLLHAYDEDDREDAAEELAKCGMPADIPALQHAATYDPEDDVREEALQAIGKIQQRYAAYATPPVTYTYPTYVAPTPTYVAPTPTYVAPAPTYVAPAPTYVAPAPRYVAPRTTYIAPRAKIVRTRVIYRPQPKRKVFRGGGHHGPSPVKAALRPAFRPGPRGGSGGGVGFSYRGKSFRIGVGIRW
jgi:hypothetical protein